MKFTMNSPAVMASMLVVTVAVLGAGTLAYTVYGKHVEGPLMHTIGGWLPAATVGSATISYGEYLDHSAAAGRFIKAQAPLTGTPSVMTDEDRKSTLDRAVRIAAVKELSDGKKVAVTSLDINRAYDQTILQTGTSTTPEEFKQYLAQVYGWTEDDFKHFILGPALLEDEVKRAYLHDNKTDDDFNKDLETAMSEPHTKRYLAF